MAYTSSSDVLIELRGQTLRVNGLLAIFASWPFAVNPALNRMRADVDCMLNTSFPDHPKLENLKAGDYALFGATWWPCASFERLRIATYLSIWLFLWDDEIDSDLGTFSDDFKHAQEYRNETLRYVNNRLGLDLSDGCLTTTNAIIKGFDEIGDAMRELCTLEQRQIFMNEVGFFMEKSEIEQRLRLNHRLPTLEEFWQYRQGTSAVRVVLTLNEFCNETKLPLEVSQDKDFAALWNLTNANICIVNDLLSIKKELAQGSVHSLIPILYVQLGSTERALEEILKQIRFIVDEFDRTVQRAMKRFTTNPKISKDLRAFVDGCRYYCTGNLSWSLSTGRYGIYHELADNSIYIKL